MTYRPCIVGKALALMQWIEYQPMTSITKTWYYDIRHFFVHPSKEAQWARPNMKVTQLLPFCLVKARTSLLLAPYRSREKIIPCGLIKWASSYFCFNDPSQQNVSQLLTSNMFKNSIWTFWLEYDCPLLADMFDLISWVSGGSLAAAESLVSFKIRITDV